MYTYKQLTCLCTRLFHNPSINDFKEATQKCKQIYRNLSSLGLQGLLRALTIMQRPFFFFFQLIRQFSFVITTDFKIGISVVSVSRIVNVSIDTSTSCYLKLFST